jgi:hypothetical protein
MISTAVFTIFFCLPTYLLYMDPPKTPPQPVHRLLTRDERLRIQLLRELNWKQAAIAEHEYVIIRQVSWTINHIYVTPQKHLCGAKAKLDYIQTQALIRFISASRTNRRMSYLQVAAVLDWPNVGEYAIQHALEREGYHRQVGRIKPPISEKNRILRLAWAIEHIS